MKRKIKQSLISFSEQCETSSTTVAVVERHTVLMSYKHFEIFIRNFILFNVDTMETIFLNSPQSIPSTFCFTKTQNLKRTVLNKPGDWNKQTKLKTETNVFLSIFDEEESQANLIV